MNQFSASMMFLGMAIAATAFIWIAVDRIKSADSAKKLQEKKEELVAIINDADQMIDEMNRFSDYIITQMDLKQGELAETLKRIEQKQIKLGHGHIEKEVSIRQAKNADIASKYEELPLRQAGDLIIESLETRAPAATYRQEPKVKNNVIPLSSRHKEVLRMREGGMNETEIARSLNVGKGEVQLILELNK